MTRAVRLAAWVALVALVLALTWVMVAAGVTSGSERRASPGLACIPNPSPVCCCPIREYRATPAAHDARP